ncbi:MAG: cell division protein FtsZ, partial [Acetobacteraceae bacterium]|nr:cell division protein FtsZ [Acetobacteraceae bacterium]
PVSTAPQAPAPAPAPMGGGLRGLFRTVTGAASGSLMRRNLPEPAPVAPRLEPVPGPARPATRPVPQDEMGLDIPTFLRRQSN